MILLFSTVFRKNFFLALFCLFPSQYLVVFFCGNNKLNYENASFSVFDHRRAIARSLKDNGMQAVHARISLFQKPIITVRRFFCTAFKLAFATESGLFAASLPHKPCARIFSFTSARVGIAPGSTHVIFALPRYSARNAAQNWFNAFFVALYNAK